ncbi:hypothetical protein AB4851_08205 [Burkholderia sp. 22PA0099]|uniref:hypothetical protein n=1 Tax=Burkholderia sp. 22PA0099 TaxID=3237372 RepID=UPI0039C327E3
MQDILLLIAASIGFAIVAIAAGVWFAGRQARRNPYSQQAFVRQAAPQPPRRARRADTSPASRIMPSVALAMANADAAARSSADGAMIAAASAGVRRPSSRSRSADVAEREAQAAAKAAVRDAHDADADAVELEHRAAQAVRNARPDASGSEALALGLQDRAQRARRYATLATQWAADARNYAELSIGEPTGTHAALAIERAMQAAGARRETKRLAAPRRGRVRGLQPAE